MATDEVEWIVPKEKARLLRRHATISERLLWGRLRGGQLDGLKFRRQHPAGGWIADFACVGARLLVEIDGASHGDPAKDARRDRELMRLGWRVLRVEDRRVLRDLDGVLELIVKSARAAGSK
jgi:very-short-patch-repair endonuclease